MSRYTMPAMTVVELRRLIAEWQDSARQDGRELQDAIEGLPGVRCDFGSGVPVPVCPACGWESVAEDQSDFQVVGADVVLGPHIRFGCGHCWAITGVPMEPT